MDRHYYDFYRRATQARRCFAAELVLEAAVLLMQEVRVLYPLLSFSFFFVLALALHRRIMASGRLFAMDGMDASAAFIMQHLHGLAEEMQARMESHDGSRCRCRSTGLEKLRSLISCNVHTIMTEAT